MVEFFTRYGLLGGLLGIGVAACVFALVLACTYEFARVFQVYDYRTFFGKLIGMAKRENEKGDTANNNTNNNRRSANNEYCR